MSLLNRSILFLIFIIFIAPAGTRGEGVAASGDTDRQKGKVLFETWVGDWGGVRRQYVRLTSEHLRRPASSSGLVDGVALLSEAERGIHKFRGFLKPVSSGIYRFHVKGQGKARFALSGDETPLGAEVLAEGGLALEGGPIDLGNPAIFPDSAPVHLEAGQSRFFEIVFYQERKPAGFSLEWIRPDGLREPVPPGLMESFAFRADDEDRDDLPDEWEKRQGLRVSGAEPRDFASGDPDFDGLSNGKEFLAGTSPTKADTDGDGVSDFLEIQLLGSRPLDGSPPVGPAVSIDIFAGKPLTYGWARKEPGTYEPEKGQHKPHPDASAPSLVNATGNGSVEWRVAVDRAGFQLVTGELQLADNLEYEILNSMEWWIDGQRLPDTRVVSPSMSLARFAFVSPALSEGVHHLRLRLRSMTGSSLVRIFALRMQPVLPEDAKERLAAVLGKSNRFTRGTGESATSPACVEIAVRGTVLPTLFSGKKQGIPLQAIGANGGWADVALPENGDPLALSAAVEGGGLVLKTSVRWTETNLLEEGDLIVRQGDSLRLAAIPTETGKPGSGKLILNGNERVLQTGKSYIRRFDKAGDEVLRGKFVPTDGSPSREVTRKVTVIPRSKPVDIGWARAGVRGKTIDFPDRGLTLDGLDVAGIVRKKGDEKAGIFPRVAGNFALPVRISPNGPICGSLLLHSAQLTYTSKFLPEYTSDKIFSEPKWEVSAMTVNLPKGAKIQLVVHNSKEWPPAGSKGENNVILPLEDANEEGILLFHACGAGGATGYFNHDVYLLLPDGSRL